MRSHTLPILVLSALLGCGATPSSSSVSSTGSNSANAGATKAPAFGPGAGAVFGQDRVLVQANGGLQTMRSWEQTTRSKAKSADCTEDSIPLTEGAVFVICTKKPIEGPKTGWTKVEITGKTDSTYTFRYAHWPSVGDSSLSGTGIWTPNGEQSTLTYTHGVDITDAPKAPEPSEPVLTEPEPSGPALTEPEPSGPALTEPEPSGPALTEPEPSGPALTKPEPTEPAAEKRRDSENRVSE